MGLRWQLVPHGRGQEESAQIVRSDLFPLEKRNRIFLGRRLIVDASTVRLIEGANSGIALNGASLTASCTTARLQSLEEGGLGSTADDLLFGTSPIRPDMYVLTPLGQIYAQAACVGLVYTKDRAARRPDRTAPWMRESVSHVRRHMRQRWIYVLRLHPCVCRQLLRRPWPSGTAHVHIQRGMRRRMWSERLLLQITDDGHS